MAVTTTSGHPIPHPPASAVLLALSGCSGQQAVTNPQSGDAALVAVLWWAMLLIASLVLIAVLALLAIAVLRAKGSSPERPLSSRRAWLLVLGGGMALPMVVVFGLVISGTHIGAEIATRDDEPAVTVDVEGKRWWWEVSYRDDNGETIATTANEIHIPVGQPVRFRLRSDNVIHSFWVPNLQGKIDLVPGRVNEVWLTAEHSGIYRGQCAEYCGTQHALMAFLVEAQPPADFRVWLEQQSERAVQPDDAQLKRGRETFTTAGCAGCHAIRGVQAVGVLGPDLTHLASRRTLAAGTIPNEPEQLAEWIRAPDSIKPGSLMPATQLDDEQLQALVAYLESLE